MCEETRAPRGKQVEHANAKQKGPSQPMFKPRTVLQ